ncbi:MAG: hypothetical protein QW707_06160 [Candidatus Bathyarchaeia archaeon]
MPPKHPLLFSALAIALAIMLFNASIIQVSGIAISGTFLFLIIVGSIAGGGAIGYFLHDFLKKQSETPGVTLSTYVWTVIDRWETNIHNVANYLRSITEAITWSKDYYGRVAANIAGNYLNQSDLLPYEKQVMRDIAYDLYGYYERTVIQGLKNFANELVYFAKNRLTGDLEDYEIYLGHYTYGGGTWSGNAWLKSATSDIKPVYRYTDKFTAWIFGSVTLATKDTDADSSPDGFGTFTFREIFTNSVYQVTADSAGWITYSIPEGIYEISYSGVLGASGLIAMDNILIIADTSNVYPALAAKFDTIHYGRGFEVWGPGGKIKDVDLYPVWTAVANIINHLDHIYDAAFNAARVKHQTCRMAGITDPSKMDACILPPPTIVMPTTENMYKMFGDKFDEWLAYYLAYLQSVNKTFQQMRTDFTGMISQLNVTFADVREKLMNVIIRLPNGSVWAELETLIPLWVSKAQEFQANASNILQGMMGAIAVFKNGTVRYIEIPPGYQIQPGTIVTPSGQVPSLVLQNWAAGLNPAYSPGNYTQPEFVQRADETIQVALQLFLVILPLILIVAVVRMITGIGGRR